MNQRLDLTDALEQIKAGTKIDDKDGVLAPLIKQHTKAAEQALIQLEEKWGKKYPIVIQFWKKSGRIYLLILNTLKILEGLFIPVTSLNLFISSLEN